MVIVSGLPRSGTSMLMSMLKAGGASILTDGEKVADEDNPKGYFEFEGVKDDDWSWWIYDTPAKAVKIVSFHLEKLPNDKEFDVLFMNRHLDEIMASQNKMLERGGKEKLNGKMKSIYQKHLNHVWSCLEANENIRTLIVGYDWVINDPEGAATKIASFLGLDLDVEAMGSVVDQKLYRNKRGNLDG